MVPFLLSCCSQVLPGTCSFSLHSLWSLFIHALIFFNKCMFSLILLCFNRSSFMLSLSFSSFSGRQTSKQTQHPEHLSLQLWICCGFFFVLWPIFFTLWTLLSPVTFLCLNLPSQVAKHTSVVTLTNLCVYFCILWQSLACETQAILNTTTLGQAHETERNKKWMRDTGEIKEFWVGWWIGK